MLRVTGSRILGILFSSMEEEDIFFFNFWKDEKIYFKKYYYFSLYSFSSFFMSKRQWILSLSLLQIFLSLFYKWKYNSQKSN